jgi:4-carboxymuconolactone decarboxylase
LSELSEKGEAIRRKVLGDAHVNRAQAAATPFDQPFQDYITSAVWGSVWSRPQLTLRERSLITIAILGALGQSEEIELHVRATKNTGASADDIREVLLHVAGYAGVPAARSAVAAAKRALAELEGASKSAASEEKEP